MHHTVTMYHADERVLAHVMGTTTDATSRNLTALQVEDNTHRNNLNTFRTDDARSHPANYNTHCTTQVTYPACSTISVINFPRTTLLFICSGTALSTRSPPSSSPGIEILIELVLLVTTSTTSAQAFER
jgi:hypothetical protein